jgi:hypothetical protein
LRASVKVWLLNCTSKTLILPPLGRLRFVQTGSENLKFLAKVLRDCLNKVLRDCLNIVNQLWGEILNPISEPYIWVMMTRCYHFLGEEEKARECWEQVTNHRADTRWRNTARDMSYDDFIVSPLLDA